jgi:hypothetical protein
MTGLAGEAYSVPQPSSCCWTTNTSGSGLLITHVADVLGSEGWHEANDEPPYVPPYLDVELADGAFDTTSVAPAPDPILGWNHIRWTGGAGAVGNDADLYMDQTVGGPNRSNAFTPYTNPNTNLYENELGGVPDWHQTVYSGISIYDVEWTSAAKESIRAKIHFGPIAAPDSADTIRVDTKWQGLMQLTGDVVVDSAATLTVAEDALVIAKAGSDRFAAGADTSGVEIKVLGKVVVEGADSTARFTSSRDDGFVHWSKNGRNTAQGEVTAPAPGDWHGIRLFDALDYNDTTGAFTVSDVERAAIWYPTFAITVDSLSGNIIDCEFGEADSADILLERDTRIPEGEEWRLLAPTFVAARDTALGDVNGMNAGKNDLLVEGALRSERPPGGSGWVTFESLPKDASTGRGWGGITVNGAVGKLHDADVAYAIGPVSFWAADTAEIVDSRIHHYNEQGILDWGSEALIQRCRVERGSGLDPSISSTGIHILQSAATVSADTVLWHPDGVGIWAEYSKTYCLLNTNPTPDDTLRIQNNVVAGNVDEPETEANDIGIYLKWMCKESVSFVEGDSVFHWNTGLSLHNASDLYASCASLEDNFYGVYYERGDATGDALFGADTLDVVKLQGLALGDNYRNGLRIPSGHGLRMGWDGDDSETGQSTVRLDQDSTGTSKLIYLDVVDPNWTGSNLDAKKNYWVDHDGSALTASEALAEIEGPSASGVVVFPKLSTDQSCFGSQAIVVRPEALAPDSERIGPADANGLPLSFALHRPSPNPARGHVTVRFDVPAGHADAHVSIYDVTGRRIRELHPSGPGRYGIRWSGETEGGGRVAAGIYFVRMTAVGFQATQRITLLR